MARKILKVFDNDEVEIQVYNSYKTVKRVPQNALSCFKRQREFVGNLPKGWKTGYLKALKEVEGNIWNPIIIL